MHGNSIKENKGEVIKHDYATTKIPEDINDFPFSKFAHEHFQVCYVNCLISILSKMLLLS